MRKIYFFTMALVCLSLISNAQVIEKNKKIIGGTMNISFNTNTIDSSSTLNNYRDSRSFSVNLSPSYGKAIKENLVTGFTTTVGYSSSKTEIPNGNQAGESKGGQFGLGIFIERFIPIGNGFSLSGRAALEVNHGRSKSTYYLNGNEIGYSKSRTYGVGVGLIPSLNYSFNRRILGQLLLNNFISIGYATNKIESQNLNNPIQNQRTSHFGFGSLINSPQSLSSLSIGFRYIL